MYISEKPILESNDSKWKNFSLKGSKYVDICTVTVYTRSRLSDAPCLVEWKKTKFSKIDFFKGFSCKFDILLIPVRTKQTHSGFEYCMLVCLCVLQDVVLYAQLPPYFFGTSYFKSGPLFSHKVDAPFESCAARKQRREDRNCRIVEGPLLHSPTNSCARFRIPLYVQLSWAQSKIFQISTTYIFFSSMFFVFFSINQGRSRRLLPITFL
jgi:hypothetical protein